MWKGLARTEPQSLGQDEVAERTFPGVEGIHCWTVGWRSQRTENWPHNYKVCIYVKHTHTSKGKTIYNCSCEYAYVSAHVHSDIYVSMHVCWRHMSMSGYIFNRGWREATLFAITKTASEFARLSLLTFFFLFSFPHRRKGGGKWLKRITGFGLGYPWMVLDEAMFVLGQKKIKGAKHSVKIIFVVASASCSLSCSCEWTSNVLEITVLRTLTPLRRHHLAYFKAKIQND